MDARLKTGQLKKQKYDHYIKFETYSYCLDMYKQYGGKILISEKLQQDHVKIFYRSFDYFCLEFDEKFLSFEPLTEIPEDMGFFADFYSECFKSTKLIEGVTNIDEIVIDDCFKDVIAQSLTFYDLMKQETDQL